MKLTKREIDGLTCPPGKRDRLVFDNELTGFAVRLTSGGAKVFLFQYHRGAAVRRVVIGRYGDITPAKARTIAEQLRGDVATGKDPAAERAATIAAERRAAAELREKKKAEAYTFKHLVDAWETTGLKTASAAHRKEGPRALRHCFATFLKLPAGEISAAEAQRRVDTLASDAPTMARRARDYARRAYNWAIDRQLLEANPFDRVILDGRLESRDRVLTDFELGAAWQAAKAMDYPFGPLLQLLILTLQRRGEVAGMRWSELSADLTTWTIPGKRTKNKKQHLVHIAEPARAVLRGIPHVQGQDLLFTTTGKTPVSGFQNAAEALRRRAQLLETGDPETADEKPDTAAHWRLHDFRRSGVTALARLGVQPHVADRLLNHVAGVMRGVMAVYQRHEFLPERQVALDLWAAHVLGVASVEPIERNRSAVIFRI